MKYIAPTPLTILEALSALAPQSSKNTLREWIKEGRVALEGIVVKNAQVQVMEGQEITVGQRKKIVGGGIQILYEDGDLVVINKPSGLLSVSAAYEKGETAHALLKAHYRSRTLLVAHRLDQDTSGAMVFAFNQKTLDGLKELFEVHDIKRAYTAIVEGRMFSPAGTWESYLYEDSQYHVHETPDESHGKLAITHYRTLSVSKRYSLLELTLETGRKNQIRVHCQAAGHSVVGDKKYGAISDPIKRLCLHAHLLAFKHPVSHKELRVESPIPEDFYRLIENPQKGDALG
ncbi:MAG: RluA family pseudouridine synthase [Candidatus Protochlamydia sp.]|nr:RluA family pseudouridine synthase [Candidatus Protochlamydia sp.]